MSAIFAGNAGKPAGSVPESDNFQTVVGIIYTVNNSIRTKDDFTQLRAPKLRHNTAPLRKRAERQSGIKQLPTQTFRCNRIVRRKVRNDAF